MSTPATYDPSTKHKLIPPHARGAVKAGHERPHYVLNAPDYDRVPVRTYLVETMMGTGGLIPERVHIVVRPNAPKLYSRGKLTEGGRLLLTFWVGERELRTTPSSGTPIVDTIPPRAIKMLADPKRKTYRHVLMPGEDGYEILQAFENLCEIRRAGADRTVRPDLLIRALDIGEERAKFLVHTLELSPK